VIKKKGRKCYSLVGFVQALCRKFVIPCRICSSKKGDFELIFVSTTIRKLTIMDFTIIPLHLYWLIVYGLVLYAVYELTTKSKTGTILITLMPLLLLPLLLETKFNGWFNILKSFTMLFVLLYVTIIRLVFKKAKMLAFLGILLYLNILEAIVKDVEMGNYFNVLTGCILLIVLSLPNRITLKRHKNCNVEQVAYPMSWTAIIIKESNTGCKLGLTL